MPSVLPSSSSLILPLQLNLATTDCSETCPARRPPADATTVTPASLPSVLPPTNVSALVAPTPRATDTPPFRALSTSPAAPSTKTFSTPLPLSTPSALPARTTRFRPSTERAASPLPRMPAKPPRTPITLSARSAQTPTFSSWALAPRRTFSTARPMISPDHLRFDPYWPQRRIRSGH